MIHTYRKMQDFAKAKLLRNIFRTFSTSNVHLKNYAAREAKFLTRIMRGEQQTKRKWFPNASTAQSSKNVQTINLPQNKRRNMVLNNLFMKYITDLLVTGEVVPELLGRGIEVSRVSVTADFSRLNVFWLAMDSGKVDTQVEEILNRAAGPLRHELSQLKVMGVVPLIQFVKDKQYVKDIEIDRRLAIADFGDDHVPTDPTLRLKSTPVLNIKLPSEVLSDIQQLEQETLDPEPEIVEEPLPDMRHDVFGLDHYRIMTTIQTSMDKSRTACEQRSLNIVSPLPRPAQSNSTVAEYLSATEKSAVFTAFLTKREVEVKRRKKMEKKIDHNEELSFIERREVAEENDVALDVDYHSESFPLK